MFIFKKVTDLQNYLSKQAKDKLIGFVPTMGALHHGHISLINESKKKCEVTVCSIFVNPTQFNNKQDFEKYPITIEQDIYLLEKAGCHILFLPNVEEVYPNGMEVNKSYELGFVETVFEGIKRPGHFNGVCMVVERLLNIVNPNILFLGQKDYQQCIVITKLVEIMNKQNTIQIEICPTCREANGLAMSSRNQRLSIVAKEKAAIIYASFINMKKHLNKSDIAFILQKTNETILQNGFDSIDYLSLANAKTLEPIDEWNGTTKIVVLFAGFIEDVRLIDNMVLN